eukprot:CAMPEP_0181364114 /NCGR_PEP_ID=MMETSP1106-20121128/9181_1 /TAXON_ID=81844 /ORGANISM="Mantoniella antarctica, Strain SL-175" /LENGTH=46 /DNA_ID= /DNA_START= /DNA_END= /DNA_ORIENTATION=
MSRPHLTPSEYSCLLSPSLANDVPQRTAWDHIPRITNLEIQKAGNL